MLPQRFLLFLLVIIQSASVFSAQAISNSSGQDILGQFTGIRNSVATVCEAPSLVGTTSTNVLTLNILTQTPSGTPGIDTISGTTVSSGNIFFAPEQNTFTGTIDGSGNITLTESNALTSTATFSNGTITYVASSRVANLAPYDACFVNEGAFTLTRSTIQALSSAGTEIINNTQTLQTFINTTITPVIARLQNTLLLLQRPGRQVAASSTITPFGNGLRFSGQSGRAAGDGQQSLAAWGNLSVVFMESSDSLTAYKGERTAIQGGIDFMPDDKSVLGVSIGFEYSDLDTGFNKGNIRGHGFTIAPYAGFIVNDEWHIDIMGGYSLISYRQNRLAANIYVSGNTKTERSFASGNINYNLQLNQEWFVIANAGLLWAQETQGNFIESNNTLNPGLRTELTQFQLGSTWTYTLSVDMELSLGATYNYDLSKKDATIAIPAGTALYQDNDDILLKGGINYYPSDTISSNLEIRHRLDRQNFRETTITASVRMLL